MRTFPGDRFSRTIRVNNSSVWQPQPQLSCTSAMQIRTWYVTNCFKHTGKINGKFNLNQRETSLFRQTKLPVSIKVPLINIAVYSDANWNTEMQSIILLVFPAEQPLTILWPFSWALSYLWKITFLEQIYSTQVQVLSSSNVNMRV